MIVIYSHSNLNHSSRSNLNHSSTPNNPNSMPSKSNSYIKIRWTPQNKYVYGQPYTTYLKNEEEWIQQKIREK